LAALCVTGLACGRTELDHGGRATRDSGRTAAAPDASADRAEAADAAAPEVAPDAGIDAGADLRPQICRERPFLVARQWSLSGSGTGAAVRDLNGDGLDDVVVTSVGGVSVLVATGEGRFTDPAPLHAGSEPREVVAADLDGDGRVDLVVRNDDRRSGGITVLMGNGDGTFRAAVDYGAGGGASWMALADFDGDGRLDIVVSRPNRVDLSFLAGKGDGTFAAATTVSTSAVSPAHFAAADYDEDGRLDIAFDGPQGVNVMRGHGDGTFGAPAAVSRVTDGTSAMVARDIDGDGHADLLGIVSFENAVAVALGRGDGTFVPPAIFPVGTSPEAVTVGDLDGDGRLDLVATNVGSDDVSLLLGTGGGTFRPGGRYVAGSSPAFSALGDVDGDGTLDLVVADQDIGNQSGGEVSVLPGHGDGTFAGARSVPLAGTEPRAVALGDVDGDGRLDVLTGNSAGSVTVARGDGRGMFAAPALLDLGSLATATAAALADLDGDGRMDLVIAQVGFTPDVNAVATLRGAGDGGFGPPLTFQVGKQPSGLAIADFDGDGRPDVASADVGDDTVSVLLGRGDGSLGPARAFAAGPGPSSVVAGDFDGDGKIDLVVADSTSSGAGWLRGNGDGTFAAPRTLPTALHPQSVAAGDFDGDGRLDVVTAGRDTKEASVLLGNGDGTFQAARRFRLFSPGNDNQASVVTADIDHDGNLDLAVALGESLSVLFGAGDGTFGRVVPSFAGLAFAGSPSYSLALGDVDGDGVDDVVTADYLAVGVLTGLPASRCP
jgi:hypothetical protein